MGISGVCLPGETSCSPMEYAAKMTNQQAQVQPQQQAAQVQTQDISPQLSALSTSQGNFLDLSV